MKIPHKHAALIKAWADGAQIQFLNPDDRWLDAGSPTWSNSVEYRIKPEPKPDCIRYTHAVDGGMVTSTTCYQQSNLKLIFDGETGKLKGAEVL